jgi:uncharacterized protein (TIGR03437 family)
MIRISSLLLAFALTSAAQSLLVSQKNVTIGTDVCILPASDPYQVSVSVLSNGTADVPFIAAADPGAPWLQVNPVTGTATAAGTTLTVQAIPAGLHFGTQQGYVAIAPQSDTTQVILIYVSVSCFPPPTIFFEQSQLNATVEAGTPPSTFQARLSTNSQPGSPPSDGIVRFSIDRKTPGSPVNWLATAALPGQSGNQGQIPLGQSDLMTIQIDPTGLSPGNYDGYLRLRDTQAQQSSADLYIALTVTPSSGSLQVPTSTIGFNGEAGGSQPAPVTLHVGTTAGSIAATLTPMPQAGSWLLVNGSSQPVNVQAPADVSVSVNTVGLSAGTYSGAIQLNPGAVSVPVQLVLADALLPSVSAGGVVNGASSTSAISPGSWVTIYGDNLAPDTTPPGRTWLNQEIVEGHFPTSLDNVSVTIDGKPTFVEWVGSSQINVQAPADIRTGNNIPVVVKTSKGFSNTAPATVQTVAPAFFVLGTTGYVAAVWNRAGGTFGIVGDPTVIAGTSPAQPGDIVSLYATGFGVAQPDVGAGVIFAAPSILPNLAQVTIGGRVSTVQGYLVTPGLYQFNVPIPQDLPDGEQQVLAQYMGFATQDNVRLVVRR